MPVTDDMERFVGEIRQQVRRETLEMVASRLIDVLPVHVIAQVCQLTVSQVEHLHERTHERPQKMLLDEPLCITTVPMAVSTKRTIQKHQDAISKLKQYLQSTEG